MGRPPPALGESNAFYLALDESCACIGAVFVLAGLLSLAVCRDMADFTAAFIKFCEIPAASSFVFRVLDPFFNAFRTSDESDSYVCLGNLIARVKITGTLEQREHRNVP